MTIDDEAIDRLVAAAQQGDPEAFGALFDHFHGPVYRFVAARVGRPSDAEDLAQLVFVKALEALPRYEAAGRPVRGLALPAGQERRHRPPQDPPRARHARCHRRAGRPRGTGRTTWRSMRQEMDSVARALRRLTPEQREAIELRFFAGLSAKEAAEAMGRQEGTVRGLQFRAIAALRRELGIEDPARMAAAGLRDDPMNEDDMAAANRSRATSSSGCWRDTRGSGWIPARPQSRRARAAIMEEAWRTPPPAARSCDGRRPDRTPTRPVRGLEHAPPAGRSLAAAALAGLLVGSTAFAASRAGGPLYERPPRAREVLTLPIRSQPAPSTPSRPGAGRASPRPSRPSARHDSTARRPPLDRL